MADSRDLFADFPNLDTSDASGFCNTGGAGPTYRAWERTVARPALEAAGYGDIVFYSIEEDSSGPLVRGVRAIHPDGRRMEWDYG